MVQDLLEDFTGVRKARVLVNLILVLSVMAVLLRFLTELHGFPDLARGPMYILGNPQILFAIAGIGAIVWIISGLYVSHQRKF